MSAKNRDQGLCNSVSILYIIGMKTLQSGNAPGRLFWLLQVCGWGGLWAFYMGIVTISGVSVPGVAAGLAMTYGTGFLTSSLMRIAYRRLTHKPRPMIMLIGMVIGLSAVGSQVWLGIGKLISFVVHGPAEAAGNLAWSEYVLALSMQGSTLLIWSVLYFAVKFWYGWKAQKDRAEKADALAHSAHLQMLRYQLNPHFLFNALNSIRALIDEDKESAKQMVTELSKFLRYSLLNKDISEVPLRDELDALRNYFAIQKIRYNERLDISFDIDPAAENLVVPGFLLHPLAENAIKYGMQTSDPPLRIHLTAKVSDQQLELTVSNTGQWVSTSQTEEPASDGTGTGLSNVRQRLANAFPENHHFVIDHADGWIHVRMSILQTGRHS